MRALAATVFALSVGAAVTCGAAAAAILCEGDDCAATQMGDDTFVAGGEVRIDAHLPGDALIAGGAVTLRGAIEGDVAIAGGTLEVSSTISEDLYAAGGEIELDGSVGGNARLAGGQVTFGRDSRIDGGVSIGAGEADFEGVITGYLQGGAGEMRINGTVEGDVDVGAGELIVGPQARIGGRLRYQSPEEARIDPAAEISGGVERTTEERGWRNGDFGLVGPAARTARFAWLAGTALLGVLVILAAPSFSARSARLAATEIGLVAITGFAFLVAIPVAAVLMMITVLGIPLGIALALGYLVAMLLGWLFAIIAIGDRGLAKFASDAAGRPGARILAFLAAFIVVALLAQLPWIGGLVTLAVVVIGTGAFVLSIWRSRRADEMPPVAAV